MAMVKREKWQAFRSVRKSPKVIFTDQEIGNRVKIPLAAYERKL